MSLAGQAVCVEGCAGAGMVSNPSLLPRSLSSPQWRREMGMGVMVRSSQVVYIAAQGEDPESFPALAGNSSRGRQFFINFSS